MNKFWKNVIMFILGCSFYALIELFFRGYTFRLMALSGGAMFVWGSVLNNKFGWKMDLLLQCGIISASVTLLEAIVGNIDYYFLHINMWDYSMIKHNALNGKICLLFSFLWFLLAFAVVFVGDAIEYYWFHEGEQPEYWILGHKAWQMPIRKCKMDKWHYIEQIRTYSNNKFNPLLDLMDKCDKNNLRDITCDEAKEFYNELIERKGENL